MAEVTVQINVKSKLLWLAAEIRPSKWLAKCDAMNLAVEANSLDELYSIIKETVDLLMLDLVADNEFDEFLRARGWEAKVPVEADRNNVKYDVPWELLVTRGQNDRQRLPC